MAMNYSNERTTRVDAYDNLCNGRSFLVISTERTFGVIKTITQRSRHRRDIIDREPQ